MIRKISALALAGMLALTGAAFAEAADNTNDIIESTVVMDINGDGTEETLELHEVGEESAYVTVAGTEAVYNFGETFFNTDMFVIDLDNDGISEIFVSGDAMSDDYYTHVLHYADGAFSAVTAPDISRGDNTNTYYPYVYGFVVGMEENHVRFSGTQDCLGTYFMERTLAYDGERFVVADDGLWRRSDMGDDPWEFWSLTLKQEMTIVNEEGEEVVLQPGVKLLVDATDKVSIVYFNTDNGYYGCAKIEKNPDSFDTLVNGVSELEMFENVPYAD